MTPDTFVTALRRERASAILRTDRRDAARPAMEAAVRGGFRILEFTLTTPGALDLIAAFSAIPGLLVGAGTVLTEGEAKDAVSAGATFLVSPVMDTRVIAAATKLGVAMIPGTATPTEMLTAHAAGAPLQKLFPAPANVGAFIRACLAPLPFLRIVPTNGVDARNAAEVLEAGAWAVGFVATLFAKEDLDSGRYDRIEARARECLAAARAATLAEGAA